MTWLHEKWNTRRPIELMANGLQGRITNVTFSSVCHTAREIRQRYYEQCVTRGEKGTPDEVSREGEDG